MLLESEYSGQILCQNLPDTIDLTDYLEAARQIYGLYDYHPFLCF